MTTNERSRQLYVGPRSSGGEDSHHVFRGSNV